MAPANLPIVVNSPFPANVIIMLIWRRGTFFIPPIFMSDISNTETNVTESAYTQNFRIIKEPNLNLETV